MISKVRVLLLGGSGQIGHAVTSELSSAGYQVHLLVRRPLPFASPTVTAEIMSSISEEAFSSALKDRDVAVYALGMPAQWVLDRKEFQRVNVDLLEDFLKALVKSKVRKLLYFSTFEIFDVKDGRYKESNGICTHSLSPYFESMRVAFECVQNYSHKHDIKVTCLHPAAVFGGLNTGAGFTNFLHNVLHRNYMGLPSILPGQFPLIHTDSLSRAARQVIETQKWGESFLVSDGMTALLELAKTMKTLFPKAYVPLEIPLPLAKIGAVLMEWGAAHLTHRAPPLARVQVEYITGGIPMDCGKAQKELDWSPLPIGEGVSRFLNSRTRSA